MTKNLKTEQELIEEYNLASKIREMAKNEEDWAKVFEMKAYQEGLLFARGWNKSVELWSSH